MDFNINNYISNLSYINKDFNSLWEEILDVVPKLTNKWNPNESNESDPLVVLLKELGIFGDKINYNIDKNILENFPDTVTQLRTAYNVFKTMGYNPKWYRSAITNVSITYNGGVGEGIISSNVASGQGTNGQGIKFTLPLFTQVRSEDSTVIYTLLEKPEFTVGTQSVNTSMAMEGTINDVIINGSTRITADNLDSQNRLYFVQPNVAQNGIFISFSEDFKDYALNLDNKEDETTENNKINRDWRRVDNIYQYKPNSYVYKFGIDPSNGSNYIQFPDDIGTLIDEGIYVKYILSSGEEGNIKRNTISAFVSEPIEVISGGNRVTTLEVNTVTGNSENPTELNSTSLTQFNFTLNNTTSTQNGANPESIEEMQKNYERVVGTFETLVTLRDYENYIYDATDSVGRHIVSNIRVSDRSNDLYTSYQYKTLSTQGDMSTQTGQIGNDQLTAYNLRLYPLNTTTTGNINNKADFDKTFNCYEGSDEKDATLWNVEIAALPKRVVDSVEEVKAINHDFCTDCGALIFLNYDIEGQIYLQKTVTRSEANEIEQNVRLAIYRNFNSRELNFGEPINYSKLIETIKGADPRIQYAAINAPIYTADKTTHTLFENHNNGLDITTRAILSGATPWTTYDSFNYPYGATDIAYHPVSLGGDDKIESIQPKVIKLNTYEGPGEIVIDDGTNASEPPESFKVGDYKVGKNETYSILTPGYKTLNTYGNYFYCIYIDENTEVTKKQGGEEGSEGTTFSNVTYLKSGSPVMLGFKQYILIYETRDAVGPKYRLEGKTSADKEDGTIVIFNGNEKVPELRSYPLSAADTVTYRTNFGSELSISTLGPDTSVLKNSYFLADSTAEDTNNTKRLRISSNSAGLCEYLKKYLKDTATESGGSYTLNIGEYLLYADYDSEAANPDLTLEVGIIGEGNTIKIGTKKTLGYSGDDDDFSSRFLHQSAKIDQSSLSSNTSFAVVNSGAIEYTANNIYNFGENYLLRNFELVGDFKPKGDVDSSEVFDIKVLEGQEIEYCQIRKTGGDYEYVSNSYGTIPKPINNGGYKMSCQLALQLLQGQGQTLESNQQVILNGDEGSPLANTTIQANMTLLYPGGQALVLSGSESGDFQLMTYTLEASSTIENLNNSTPFFNMVTFGDDDASTTVTFPGKGDDNKYFIFAYLLTDKEGDSVNYGIAQGGGSLTIKKSVTEGETKKLSGMSRLYGVSGDAKFYDAKNILGDSEPTIANLFGKLSSISNIDNVSEVDAVKQLDENALYAPDFCPLYINTTNPIDNPTDPNSFFLSNHPCNRYVLPKLKVDGMNPLPNLKVSELSIRSTRG